MRKRTSIVWALDEKILADIVHKSNSIADILRFFGFSSSGTMYRGLKERFSKGNIDYSHIKLGLNNCKGKKHFFKATVPLSNILVENSTFSNSHLKKRLIKGGILVNKCSICRLGNIWNGKKMVLILDHKNGKRNDNRLVNLRLVCPNCNSQLSTTCGKNRRKIRNCINCGCVIGKGSTRCCKCASVFSGKRCRKVKNRPSKENLLALIDKYPMTEIGRMYGVSSNAVNKWRKRYGIVLENRRGYWTKR